MRKWTCILIASALLASCARMKDPEFRRVEQFGVKKLGFDATTVGFMATYYNPNNFGVTVKEAVIDVYVDTATWGNFARRARWRLIK
jgi:LEA14-like dessication related protein